MHPITVPYRSHAGGDQLVSQRCTPGHHRKQRRATASEFLSKPGLRGVGCPSVCRAPTARCNSVRHRCVPPHSSPQGSEGPQPRARQRRGGARADADEVPDRARGGDAERGGCVPQRPAPNPLPLPLIPAIRLFAWPITCAVAPAPSRWWLPRSPSLFVWCWLLLLLFFWLMLFCSTFVRRLVSLPLRLGLQGRGGLRR